MHPDTLLTLKLDIAQAVHGCRHPHLAALLAWAADNGVYDEAVWTALEAARLEPADVQGWWQTATAKGPLNGFYGPLSVRSDLSGVVDDAGE